MQKALDFASKNKAALVAYVAIPTKGTGENVGETPPGNEDATGTRSWWLDSSGTPVEKPGGGRLFQDRDTLIEALQVHKSDGQGGGRGGILFVVIGVVL